jgi:CheY-like chemotaxis protein
MAKVLLVEDDNNLREIFQMRLQAEGYTALTAADGEEGLVVAMKEKPELIVADVMMPKLSGFEMIENLRAAPEMKDTKVIMMTALGQAEDQARGEKLGVVKYLVKSQVTLEDFARVVKEVLGPGDPQAAAATPQNSSSANNSQESENSMPEDTSNPAPTNNDAPAGAPMPDASQQSTADEQSAVQSQVENFAASAPAGDAPAPADMPSADTGGAPAMPTSEPPMPAPEPPASTEPAQEPSTPPAPASGEGESSSAPTDPTSNAL